MDESTVRFLNDLNRRFYETTAAAFDATRQQAWQGWERIVPHLKPGMRVLDVGCGNGRFGAFLAARLGAQSFSYSGIDSSVALLERARIALNSVDARLVQRDLVEQPLDSSFGQFDLVALFGVLHHIPAEARRLALVRQLGERVMVGGLLVWSEWRFMDVPRLRERVVGWDAAAEVEPGDHLLDWRRGERALRYCHHVDEAEHSRLLAAAGLPLIDEYHADAANLYAILQKPLA